MTMFATSPFRLGVSFHTLDPKQRLETIEILAGSIVKSVELWEPTFGKSDGVKNGLKCPQITGIKSPLFTGDNVYLYSSRC